MVMITKNTVRILSLTAIVSLSTLIGASNLLTDISKMTANTIHYGPSVVPGEPLTIYSHGLLCNKWIGGLFHCDNTIKSPNAFIQGPMISFSYPDWFAPLSTCVGQEEDLAQIHSVCKDHTHIILVGCSRGGGTIVSYLGMYKPTNIIGAVIESPFDDTRNVINYLADQINIQKRSVIDKIANALAPNHKQDGIQPIDHVADITQDIPLLFICTTKDRIIPLQSCLNLYTKARVSGHKKCHLWISEHGAHGLITISSDGPMMRNVIHAFYKEYDLPYNAEWADAGRERFQDCQPSAKELDKLYPKMEN